MYNDDKYDTLEKIGHGSFGVIRKVRRKTDGFIMCRKEISYLRMSQKEREQLHAEFQILSHLRHPNIVAYYHREHLKATQDLHLYMEYCGNGDLGRVIEDLKNKGQRAQESFVWSIFTQLSMALYRCHYGVDPPEVGANVLGLSQGTAPAKAPAGTMTILHRDLKPENVFLGEDNSVKLGDFGLSKMIKSHDFASTYVGTPFYMSPEICAAERYTLKSDIWSLGCIIYELCAREPPFNARTHVALVQKIKDARVADLPDVYSAELNTVIRDCLKVNPDKRPDTASLLNLPIARLMRKEKEVADYNKTLKIKEDALRQREKDIFAKTTSLAAEKERIKEELDASLRREWEVKARLEIDKHINAEIEQLHKRFEDEVESRVNAELQKKTVAFAPREQSQASSAKSDHQESSVEEHSEEDLPSGTDMTDYSVDSPDSSKELKKPSARTPFARAQTMFAAGVAGTPMDVEMASPSPIAIASLSLSPRRTDATKAPTTHHGNIFAVNASKKINSGLSTKWDLPPEPTLIDSDEDDDDDIFIPSPTQHRSTKSVKNPFTSKDRPVLKTQMTAPVPRAGGKPITGGGLVSKMVVHSQPDAGPRSPSPRRLSKIPSAANLHDRENAHSTLKRATSFKGDVKSSEPLATKQLSAKSAPSNVQNIKGRTLVELQQARAGGRPLSTVIAPGVNSSRPLSRAETEVGPGAFLQHQTGMHSPTRRRRASGEGCAKYLDVAVWDPEKCDDMPSPFIQRQKRAAGRI